MGVKLLTSLSFKRLYDEYEHRLIAIAFSYVRDSDVAKDIVNDSFMALWERRDKVEFTNIEGYLFQIVRNNCLLYRRSVQTGRSVFEKILRKERGAMEYYTKTIESCDPAELFKSEIMEICKAELERMPELTREIFKAHKLEGKSYKEISAQFNIEPTKVDKELRKAVVKLRHSLRDYLPLLIPFL